MGLPEKYPISWGKLEALAPAWPSSPLRGVISRELPAEGLFTWRAKYTEFIATSGKI